MSRVPRTRTRPRILCVDDESPVLEGLKLMLRHDYEVVTATRAAAGLRAVIDQGPFIIVISDFRMPEMDGAELLGRVRDVAPDTIRILLTGEASLEGAIACVNKGFIFRFLTKPCPKPVLLQALEHGLEQARLVTADRQLLAGKLEAMSGHLLRAERLATLGTLAGAVGHELNNILTAYRGALSFLKLRARDGLPPEDEDMETLVRVGEHLKTHAAQLLRLGRPAPSGEAHADLCRVVCDTIAMLRLAGVTRRIEVHVDVPPRPLVVRADRTRIEQVLVNLIKNGVEAMGDGSSSPARLEVTVREVPEGVSCRVADTGCGIGAETLASIFEPYYTTKGAERGTGLGLFVVKQIVEAAGGTVAVSSEPGRGTAFELRLPVEAAAD